MTAGPPLQNPGVVLAGHAEAGGANPTAAYADRMAEPDVLASPPAPPGRRRLLLVLVVAALAAAVAFALTDGGEGGSASPPADSSSVAPTDEPDAPGTATGTGPAIDPADQLTGSFPAGSGVPGGSPALAVAQGVADSYCDQISTWRITLDTQDAEYLRVLVLMRPNGPAYRTVVLNFELAWNTDHYDWVGSRSALEACP